MILPGGVNSGKGLELRLLPKRGDELLAVTRRGRFAMLGFDNGLCFL
jgi:hypothetical protein